MPPKPPTPRKSRRSWPQRLTLAIVCIAAFSCFAAAGALAGGVVGALLFKTVGF